MAPARLVGVILVTAAVLVVGFSAAAVLLLRREPATPASQPAALAAAEPPRVAPHPVIPVRALPPVPAGHVEHAAKPPRRTSTGGAATTNQPPAMPAADHPQDRALESAAAEREQRRVESMAQDVIEGLRASGETRGLAAFPPKGTDPIKTGLVVPDDFQLPEGYVRHYQTTDDGQRLEAILMFSPDYKFVDADGRPVALPDDGIVPPDMAPPGLPLRTLEIPAPPRTAAGARANGR